MAVHLIHQQCQFLGPSFSMKLCEQPAIIVFVFQLMRTLCRNQRIGQYVIQRNNDDFVRQYGDLELDYLSLVFGLT